MKPVSLKSSKGRVERLLKCPTGVQGLDEITLGGLPRGRPTLLCGGAGCGKTLLGMEFLVRGATQYGEPGVCICFEENAAEIVRNVASLGFDVNALMARRKMLIDYVFVERSQIEEAGEYDLEALFVRIGHAVDSIGAKRVLLDTIESLFSGLSNESILRAELRRLFRWLKDRGLTTIITGERGEGTLTRHGLEEYVSDCVILLDHRVENEVFTRRMRVVKYRGSTHGTNEYPFLIGEKGITVLPVTSLGLQHEVSAVRVSSGIPALDAMLGGSGYYRGSSVLISGTAGTGKTSLCAHFADAACRRGERCLYLSFEESRDQLIRNMRSIGVNLGQWVRKGLLQHEAWRPTSFGLETHLVRLHQLVEEARPHSVVIDPVTSLLAAASALDARGMLLRWIDYLKGHGITGIFTTLTVGSGAPEESSVGVSSLMDTWIILRDIESSGERNRGIHILKSRGMAHSNQVREFLLTDRGVDLREIYLGPAGVLTGSARLAQEAREKAEGLNLAQAVEAQRLDLARKRRALEAQIGVLRDELAANRQESKRLRTQESERLGQVRSERSEMARSRRG